METVLIIGPDGTIHCLYTEEIDLRGLGELSIRRATSVEWDEATQEWVATLLDGGEVLARCPSRREALDAEVSILNERLFGNWPLNPRV